MNNKKAIKELEKLDLAKMTTKKILNKFLKKMKVYQGYRDNIANVEVVTINGKPLPLRLDLANHSPTGFNWGYGGSGAAQLALAILADYLQDDEKALTFYQKFKWERIATIKENEWVITGIEIRGFFRNLENEEKK
jgi:hypothetical protein